MKSIICLVFTIMVSALCAENISKENIVWKDSENSLWGLSSTIHEAEIKTAKNSFVLRRAINKFPNSKKSYRWGILIKPNSKATKNDDTANDKTLQIEFDKVGPTNYQVEVVWAYAPDMKRLEKSRTESVVVAFGYKAKSCELQCDDFKYAINEGCINSFGKGMDILLKSQRMSIQYKNGVGKLMKVEYNLSELKQLLDVIQSEAKKYNEVIEFKFSSKAK